MIVVREIYSGTCRRSVPRSRLSEDLAEMGWFLNYYVVSFYCSNTPRPLY